MKARTVVIFGVVLLVLALGFVFAWVVRPRLEQGALLKSSAAGNILGTFTVAGDTYLGYWFLDSPEFHRQLQTRRYTSSWTNDKGNYPERHQLFSEGKYDIIVLPISTYLVHAEKYRYPGVIPAVLSESKGADAIVGYADRIVGQDNRQPTINDLNNANLRICFTPDSPSSTLLQIPTVHFALSELQRPGPWRIETTGSGDAYNRLRKHECDVAVLWEPDVSKALEIPGVVTIFGSDQVAGMIVDVFVVRRSLFDDPQKLEAFFAAYFATLNYYSQNEADMVREMRKLPDFGSEESLKKALDRIAWFDLADNCTDWFDVEVEGVQRQVRRERIIDAIRQITNVSIEVGDFPSDPLKGNPFSITNFDLLKGLCSGTVVETADIGAAAQLDIPFKPLSPEEWAQLRVVGKMRISPITFDVATERLTADGQNVLSQVATSLTFNYPQYRILVRGHSAPGFTPEAEQANLVISQRRADIVRNYLETIHGIQSERLLAVGVGSKEPPSRNRGEGELSYRNRHPRVEFILLEDK